MTLPLTWFDFACAAFVAGLLSHWAIERRRLRTFVKAMGPLPSASVDLAMQVARRLADRRMLRTDPPFITPFFASVGSTPSDLIRYGGCCSGVSRLLMLCLSELGVRANQITVHSSVGEHCLVEVHPPDGPAIVDPVYAVFYTDGHGRHVGLEDLQSGTLVEVRPIEGALVPGYLDDEYHNFSFPSTKTANWRISWQRRLMYALLRRVTLGAIDRLRVPQILEWPQVLLALAVGSVQAAVHAVARTVGWLAG